MPPVIVLEGLPASGKTALADYLRDVFGATKVNESRVAVAGAVVVVAAYLTFFSGPGPAIAQTTNIRGWAWSGTTGWISLNSANCSALPAAPKSA